MCFHCKKNVEFRAKSDEFFFFFLSKFSYASDGEEMERLSEEEVRPLCTQEREVPLGEGMLFKSNQKLSWYIMYCTYSQSLALFSLSLDTNKERNSSVWRVITLLWVELLL